MKKNNFRESNRKMVITAMFLAITVILSFTPIGMIPLPPPLVNVTTVHIPVLLAVLAEGPAVGLIVGLAFGVCSLILSWESGAFGLALFFRNPLVSVLPRLLVPLIAFGVYALLQKINRNNKINDKVLVSVAAVFGSIANTVFCLGAILLLYHTQLTNLINEMVAASNVSMQYANNAATWLVAAVGLPNGISEAIAAAIIVPLVKVALDAVAHRGRRRGKSLPKEG